MPDNYEELHQTLLDAVSEILRSTQLVTDAIRRHGDYPETIEDAAPDEGIPPSAKEIRHQAESLLAGITGRAQPSDEWAGFLTDHPELDGRVAPWDASAFIYTGRYNRISDASILAALVAIDRPEGATAEEVLTTLYRGTPLSEVKVEYGDWQRVPGALSGMTRRAAPLVEVVRPRTGNHPALWRVKRGEPGAECHTIIDGDAGVFLCGATVTGKPKHDLHSHSECVAAGHPQCWICTFLDDAA